MRQHKLLTFNEFNSLNLIKKNWSGTLIDGDEIKDDATTSLGDAVDSYLGVSIADYGAAVGQPIIRGMSGPRVKILKNGMVNRDVSGLGVDHLNDVDLHDIEQIEIIKGPSSLLYANGTIGGIINVVNNTIAREDFDGQEVNAGLETQSANDGDIQEFNYKNLLGGWLNFSLGYKNTELGNIVEKAGIRVDPKDQLGFFNALDYLIKNEKRRLELGNEARNIAQQEFSKEVVLENFEKFINKAKLEK